MSSLTKPDPGLFIVKGDIVGANEFTISVDENGEIETSPIVLTSGVDMTPFWLGIAFQHMKSTEKWHKKLMLAKKAKNDAEIGRCLKKEASYGMQSIVASGIAVDAYCASIKNCIRIKADLSKTWRKKRRTARYKQISEVLRLAFPMKKTTFTEVRNNLNQIFSWRDKAVHPTSGTSSPSVHKELNKITDWRYATFRYYNVNVIFSLTLSLIYTTATNPPAAKHKKLHEYCDGVVPKLAPWVKKWERKYGKLLPWYT